MGWFVMHPIPVIFLPLLLTLILEIIWLLSLARNGVIIELFKMTVTVFLSIYSSALATLFL